MQQIFIEINKTLKSDTPGRTYSISGVKSCVLKKHFWLKNDGEIPANLPSQFSLSGQICLHWAGATLKGLAELKKNLEHLSLSFLRQKLHFKTRDFSPPKEWVLAGVRKVQQN